MVPVAVLLFRQFGLLCFLIYVHELPAAEAAQAEQASAEKKHGSWLRDYLLSYSAIILTGNIEVPIIISIKSKISFKRR